ncbi:MAG: hypothetical protein ACXABK_04500 [Candidatus Heimdallarchaeaceae archaeon]|jgi:hypothetical protein
MSIILLNNFLFRKTRQTVTVLKSKLEEHERSYSVIETTYGSIEVDTIALLMKTAKLNNLVFLVLRLHDFLIDFLNDFRRAILFKKIRTSWIDFRIKIIEDLSTFYNRTLASFEKINFDYFHETYSSIPEGFLEQTESITSAELQDYLELFQRFTLEVGSYLKNMKELRNKIIPDFIKINNHLKRDEKLSWDKLYNLLDTIDEGFHQRRSIFLSKHSEVYLLIAAQKIIKETESISVFSNQLYRFYPEADKIISLLLRLRKIIVKIEGEFGIRKLALINFSLGKFYLDQQSKIKALSMLLEAHYMYKQLIDSDNEEDTRKPILKILEEESNHKEQEKIKRVILEEARKQNDSYLESLVYISFVNNNIKADNISEAERYIKKAIKCSENIEDPHLKIITQQNIEELRKRQKLDRLEEVTKKESIEYLGNWKIKCHNCNNLWIVPDIQAKSLELAIDFAKLTEQCPICKNPHISREFYTSEEKNERIETLLGIEILESAEKKIETLVEEHLNSDQVISKIELEALLVEIVEEILEEQRIALEEHIDVNDEDVKSLEKDERIYSDREFDEIIISDDPYDYKGTWLCHCEKCQFYWEVIDLTSMLTGPIEGCPKCESENIEKEKIEL